VFGQSEKPQTIIVPTGSLGDISEVRKKMLEKTLESKLDDYFDIVPKELFEEAQEQAFQEMDSDECTEDQCILMIKEILQIENAFKMDLIIDEGDTQISITWNDQDQKRVEEDYCEGCKTKNLINLIGGLVEKLVGVKDVVKEKSDLQSVVVEKNNLENNEEYTESITGMKFVKILNRNYWLGKFEVTQNEWMKLTNENPSHLKLGDLNHPVNGISWKEVHKFLYRLNKLNNEKIIFRLPTKKEWEHGCLGGNDIIGGKYGTADGFLTRKNANYGSRNANYGSEKDPFLDASDGFLHTSPVGSFSSNPFGLFDMTGNVKEWIEHEKTVKMTTIEKINFKGDFPTGDYCLHKGGSFNMSPSGSTCKFDELSKSCRPSDWATYSVGFRILMEKK